MPHYASFDVQALFPRIFTCMRLDRFLTYLKLQLCQCTKQCKQLVFSSSSHNLMWFLVHTIGFKSIFFDTQRLNFGLWTGFTRKSTGVTDRQQYQTPICCCIRTRTELWRPTRVTSGTILLKAAAHGLWCALAATGTSTLAIVKVTVYEINRLWVYFLDRPQ
jgi:hypothetical protein